MVRRKRREIREKIIAKKRLWRFITIFAISSTILYSVYYLLRQTFNPLKDFTAVIVANMICAFGFNAKANGNIVTIDGFSMEIIDECVGIFSSIVYVSGVIAYPSSLRAKSIGIAFGIPILYLIDIFRLIILAFVGVSNPEIFDYVHVYLWQVTFILLIWIYIGKFYQDLVLAFSKPILILMGYERFIPALRLGDAYLVNFNLVPFLALIFSIKLENKKRLKLMLLGFFFMFFIHCLDLIAHFPAFFNKSQVAFAIVVGLPILNFGFPFIIWVLWVIDVLERLL